MTAIDQGIQTFRIDFSTFAGDLVATDYLTAAGYDAAAEHGQRKALTIPAAEWLELYQRDSETSDAAEYVGGWEVPAAECGRCAELLFTTATGLYDRRGRQVCGTGTTRHEPAGREAPVIGRYSSGEDCVLSGESLIGARAAGGKSAGSELFVVDCRSCWFPGGAPVTGDTAALQVAGRHDDAAHGGVPTAEVVPPWGEVR